ncbi:MAG: hypothetical protein GEU73_08005 [Chloroflexi bacterium]|nr:hypothetical protein [Chloroflexota bacterium]
MASVEKRLEHITRGLSAEQKAKLVIEDGFREHPILSPAERHRMCAAMGTEGAQRYNAYLDRYDRLRELQLFLGILASQAMKDLLERDRILWHLDALEWLTDHLAFSRPLFADNLNLKPGRPITVRTLFADVRLGVWGKERSPFPTKGSMVEARPVVHQALDIYVQRIRATAADMRAVLHHITEEARAMELDYMEGAALRAVQDVREHDVMEDGGAIAKGAIFPVPDEWALQWDAVEENPETLRRARVSTDGHFYPASMDRGIEMLRPRHFEDMKRLARDERHGSIEDGNQR